MPYDSRIDTKKHIKEVQKLGAIVTDKLSYRLLNHDRTKLWPPEKTSLDNKDSDNTKYLNKKYNPESYENGIKDMTLIDLMEMLTDWKAELSDNKKVNIMQVIKENKDKYKYSKELKTIFENTIKDLGW